MPKVAGVRLRYSKTLWFEPGELVPEVGDIVIVETERGQEIGLIQHGPHDVEESALKAPLKPIVRIATAEDLQHVLELGEKEKAAMPKFKELIEKNKLDMKPTDIEYLFGGDKIVFYFSAEERVDFRSLVKDLAAYFHMRIDMRQVGVRDEARMVGGLGHCGEVLCCARLGGEFAPVSIKMAKDQGLPLNPLKISGRCGRLMCCLRYEVGAYQDFNARSPRRNALVETPRGEGKVVDIDALREIITLQFQGTEDDGPQRMDVPLCKMNCEKKDGNKCCCSISHEVFEELSEEKEHPVDNFFFPTPSFKTLDNGESEEQQSEKRPEGRNQRNAGGGNSGERDGQNGSGRNKRRRRGKNQGTHEAEKNTRGAQQSASDKPNTDSAGQAQPQQKQANPKRRRRGGRPKDSAQRQGNPTQREQGASGEVKMRPSGEKSSAQRSSSPSRTGSGSNQPSARSVEPGQRIPRRRNRSKD